MWEKIGFSQEKQKQKEMGKQKDAKGETSQESAKAEDTSAPTVAAKEEGKSLYLMSWRAHFHQLQILIK